MAIKFLSGLNLSNVTAGSILKLDSNGNIVAAVSGTDYNTAAGAWSDVSSDIYRNSDVRIGTYQSGVAPAARLHVFDYQTTDPKLLIEDGNTGDASMQFKISTKAYTMGIDNSDSDKFILAASSAFGTTNALEITTTGVAAFQKQVLFNEPISVLGTYGRWKVNGYGGMYFNNDSDTNNTRYIHARSDGGLSIGRGATASLTGTAPDEYFATSFDQLYIKSDGKVGINTSSPAHFLDVNGNISGTTIYSKLLNISPASTGNGMLLSQNVEGFQYHAEESSADAPRYWVRFDYTNGSSYPYLTNRTPSGAVVIKTGTANGGSENEHFRIKGGNGTVDAYFTNANLGIGTSSPEEKLHVIGNIKQNDYIIGRGAEHKVATMPDYYKIAQVTIDGTYGTSHRIEGTVSYGGDNEKSTKIEFWISFRSGGNLNIGTPLVRYGYRVENLNVASSNGFESGSVDTAFRVSKTSDTSGGNKVYEIQFSPNDSNYISAQWEVKYSDYGNQGSYPTTVYSTLQSYGTDISDANILKSQDSTRVDNNTWITQLGVGSSNNTSFSFYNNNTSYFNGSVTIDANLSMTGGGYITTDSSNALTLRSDVQHGQGDTDAVISFKQSTSELGKFDQDGYLYAAGFKTSGTTGFLKSDGTVDTTTLGTMAAAATSDYKTSDQTETYVATELASYTLTSALGTAATTASTDYATAAQGTTADAALPKGSSTISTGVHLNLKHTTSTGYSEMSMSNNNNDKLVFGSIGSGYTNSAWAGARYIYSTSGELRIKATTNLKLYSGGVGDTNDLSLTLDTSNNATFAGAVTTGGKLYIGSTDATSTATTALLLGAAGEVKKRGLGSNAFTSTTIPTGTASSKAVTDFIQDFGTSNTSDINTIGNASGKYRWNNTTTGRPASSQANEYGTLLNLHYSGNVTTQIAHDIDQANLWIRSLNTESDTGTAWKQIADTAYVSAAVAGIVGSAPAALDTLNELAAALGNDSSFSTTMSTALGNRLRIDVNNQSLSSTELTNARTNLGLGTAATAASTAFVAVSGDTMTGNLTMSSATPTLKFSINGAENNAGIVWEDGDAGDPSAQAAAIKWDASSNHMRFYNNDEAAERIRINSDGTTTFLGTINASAGIGGLTLANGGISGTNYNITGVNQLEIADPGEGIVFKSGASGDMTLAIVDDTSDNILRFSGTNAVFDVAGSLTSTNITIADGIYHEGDGNTNITFGTDAINLNTGGGDRINITNSITKVNNDLIIAGGETFSLGERAEGDDNGRTVLIEGVANGSNGEGSGRIFFSEHNSTDAAADKYGLSLYYEGDPNAQLPSGFQPNTGNGTWSLRRHNNSLSGDAIMSGGRSDSNVNFAGNITSPNLTVGNAIYHDGDNNTYIWFTTDRIRIDAGGVNKFDSNNTYVIDSAPAAPTNLSLSVVNDTVNVTFTASATSGIDSYFVFSSVDGGDYSLISMIAPDDFGATMSIIDNAFDATGTQAYRIYAVKNGIISADLTGSISYSVTTPLEPTNMSVVNLNTAFYVQWDAPSANARFVTAYNVYKHEHATESSLDRDSATLIYSGNNYSYMYQISGGDNNNFHKFWVETTVG